MFHAEKFLCAVIPASLVLLAAASVFAAGQWVKVNGMGATADCGNLVEWKDKDKTAYDKAMQWELGYLSGAALMLPRIDPIKNLEEEDVVRWLSNYCASHLEQNLSEAADKFLKEHRH